MASSLPKALVTLASLCGFALALALVGCREKTQHTSDAELTRGPVVRSAPKKLVVLGSSTSAGTGPRDPNDAYVPRYQAYLARRFPDVTLVNLALGGQTTYHLQPTDFAPPANRPAPVAGKNITAALAENPSAIIVNLPSNDAASGISVSEQLDNFTRVAKLAHDARVPLWLTTTQPRNFSERGQVEVQRQVRDVILRTYTPRTLDFWTPFAAVDGTIKGEYDAGDGVHLNAAAHTVLLRTMVSAKLPETLLESSE